MTFRTVVISPELAVNGHFMCTWGDPKQKGELAALLSMRHTA